MRGSSSWSYIYARWKESSVTAFVTAVCRSCHWVGEQILQCGLQQGQDVFSLFLELLHIAKQVLIPMGLSTKTEQEKRRLKERQFDAIVNLCNIDQAASFDDDAGGFEYESEQ